MKHDALVQTTITKNLAKDLKAAAALEGLTVAAFLRRLIMRWHDKKAAA